MASAICGPKISFNLLNSPHWSGMLRAFRASATTYSPPSRSCAARSRRRNFKSCKSTRTCAPTSVRTSLKSAPRSPKSAEKQIAAEDQLKRIDLKAPQSGTVKQLEIHTIGGVVTAGQPVMLIVPDKDKLVVEAKVPPQEIDRSCRATGNFEVYQFQSTYDAGVERHRQGGSGRRFAGREVKFQVLHHSHQRTRRRNSAPGAGQAHCRDAGRGVHPDFTPNCLLLSRPTPP